MGAYNAGPTNEKKKKKKQKQQQQMNYRGMNRILVLSHSKYDGRIFVWVA